MAFRVLIVAAVVVAERWTVAVALHASHNVAWALFPVGGSHYEPAYIAPIVAVAAGLILWRGVRGIGAHRALFRTDR